MAKRRRPGGATPAIRVLEEARVPHTVHPYDHDPAVASFGLEAAEALGVPPARVFKTLLVQADARLVVGIVPVSAQLDLKSLAAAVEARRATMADPADAERATGYVVGGISPLGQRRSLPTVLDDSARAHASVYVSAGRRGLDVELAPDDLVHLLGARFAAISRW